jgi:glycosyltransferase involved in cell wall biosynthesis
LWKRPLIELRQWVRTGAARYSALRVAQAAMRHRAELIHTNTILTPEGGLAARLVGLPHVWHLRELLGPGEPFQLPIEGAALGRYLERHCSKLVANSGASAAKVRSFLQAELLEVVPNGIDLAPFSGRARAAGRASRVVVGMVAHLTSRVKKHRLFVEAAARVGREVPIEFRIYGHDPSEGGRTRGDAYTDELHDRIRVLGLADRFTWPGYVPDPVQAMSEIDLLICPNHEESFGRVAIEAMATGLPVVGARGGGVGEIIEHGSTGLLAAPGDADGLAAAIARLAADAELRLQMGEAGRRRVERLYSLEACADGIMRVYGLAMQRPLSAGAGVTGLLARARAAWGSA